MKKVFRKNQVIITALAIMIVVAGYLQFSEESQDISPFADSVVNDLKSNEVEDVISKNVGEDTIKDSKTEEDLLLDISDGDTTEIASADEGMDLLEDTTEVMDNGELSLEDNTKGEAVLANNTLTNNFFSSAKLKREQTRAKNKEDLMSIIENSSITEEQKQNAIDEMIALTSIAEKETATESLLEGKGFKGCVVSIVDDSVDVLVSSESITDQQVAQIEDIITRKTGATAENIVITPVGNE